MFEHRPLRAPGIVNDVELLERDRELSALRVLAKAAGQGSGQLALVEGPAGIGKTRLLAAARDEAIGAGSRVVAARGSQLEREYAHGIVLQLFEPVLANPGVDRDELLGGAAAQAAALFSAVRAGGTGAVDVSFATLHGLFWLTANLCAQGPLVLVVDDLHWADTPSLRFLAYLLPRLEGLPLLIVAGVRPAEPGADQRLLAQISTDPVATTIRPATLSPGASTRLVRSVLNTPADDEFCRACHTAAGGNPLLVRELAEVAAAEGLDPVGDSVNHLLALGPRVVGQRVTMRLMQLGSTANALCDALAILGDDASLADAATLSNADPTDAQRLVDRLVDIGILCRHPPATAQRAVSSTALGFVHPLVRTAVYDRIPEQARREGHLRAARLLAGHRTGAERVAAHLLLVAPSGDPFTVAMLRQAADEAFARGAPESAVTYLERCAAEPLADQERPEVLFRLGAATQLVDVSAGADRLADAMAVTDDPDRQLVIAQMRATALQPAGRVDEALQVTLAAIEKFGAEYTDIRRRFEALLLGAAMLDPRLRTFAAERAAQLRSIRPAAGAGAGMLDIALSYHDALAGQPADQIAARVRRGVAEGALSAHVNVIAVYACHLLIAADQEAVLPILDTWVTEAYQRGSIRALSPSKCFQGAAWLARGALADAETTLREAMWAATTASQNLGRPVIGTFLADALMEQGRLDAAAVVLDDVAANQPLPSVGYWYWLIGSRGRLLILQGRAAEGLETVLASGSQFAAVGGRNPALSPWRSDAALALLALDRRAEARRFVDEEVALARRWGAPGTLGRSLRVAGLVRGQAGGLEQLREAVSVLEDSPARLEHAKALIELGAALRRAGHRRDARQPLRTGVDLAQVCGAWPVVDKGHAELRASGVRSPRAAPTGREALTPGERRVAELAAAGKSNRDIAQALFITTNTVEVHLTRTYRKLGVTGRAALADSLSPCRS